MSSKASANEPPETDAVIESLCAFVVRSRVADPSGASQSPALTLVDLGPIEPIGSSVLDARLGGVGAHWGSGLTVRRRAMDGPRDIPARISRESS